MHQFGAAARGAFPEVALLQQEDLIATGSGVHGASDAGSATTDDHQVPWLGTIQRAIQHLHSIHTCGFASNPLARDNAWFHRPRKASAFDRGMRGSKRSCLSGMVIVVVSKKDVVTH